MSLEDEEGIRADDEVADSEADRLECRLIPDEVAPTAKEEEEEEEEEEEDEEEEVEGAFAVVGSCSSS